ncbi:target of EGR1 protein 1 isoform X1 [Hemiscyllium ocellatum]|uniref:target of EGR1 protein 1 isoform X1 n=2 Tax=Hemiscyllium ocellatum TaxID=170820 RepID=UPI002965E7F4|nr:target of EGR1 protein 1 isoform X1 [Hemiscyllium ocellatum]
MEVFSFCNLMKMAFTKVPVVDVHIDNFKEVWPSMLLAVRTASFIALDTELSGLGTRKALLAQSIEDRYKAICNAARTRSVLSLGIASFKELSHKPGSTYLSQVYNLTLLCMDEYIIEPQSVQFLVQHGFDFNKQYSKGIPYHKGNDKPNECRGQNMRGLFLEIIQSKKPLILHNGLIDLAFLYQCFYANLPDQLMTFTADVSEMFPAGVYDTKYTSEVETRFVSSYLEYAYKKCRRENNRLIDASNSHLSIEFCNYQQAFTGYIDYRCCNLPEADKKISEEGICERFSAYGWCPNGMKCSLSHNTDLIIEEDERNNDKKKKKVRRKRKQNTAELTDNSTNCMFADNVTPADMPPSKLLCDSASMEPEREIIGELMQEKSASDAQLPETTFEEENKDNPYGVMDTEGKILSYNKKENHPEGQECTGTKLVEKSKIEKCEGGTHRAGFDAFMTGFIMAYILMWKNGESNSTKMDPWLPDCHNKLYLSGKTLPLQICKSSFSKSSKVHQAKIELLWGKQ